MGAQRHHILRSFKAGGIISYATFFMDVWHMQQEVFEWGGVLSSFGFMINYIALRMR